MYLFVFAFVVMGACIAGWAITYRLNECKAELKEVKEWFSERLQATSPQPLSSRRAAMIEEIISKDADLCLHLERGVRHVDCEPYYKILLDFGRHLNVLGELSRPTLYYGVFDENNIPVFRTWIEFRHQGSRGGQVWVLYESSNNSEASLQIASFSDFMIGHPGLMYRRPVYSLPEKRTASMAE